MTESTVEQSHADVRERRRLLSWPALAALLVVVAAVATLVRLPVTISNLDQRASFNANHSDALYRATAGADAEGIDNTFLAEALQLVPANATYAVVVSQTPAIAQTYGISAATYDALGAFVRNVMLPRRPADPAKAQYVLCYACDTDPFDKRGMKRLWQNGKGLVIGELPH